MRSLRRAVPFEGFCLLTFDPATLLPTGEVVENGLHADLMPRLTEIELSEPDFNKFTSLVRADRPAASLSEATAGQLDRSLRQRELRRPSGFADELRAACTDATGAWGALTLLRETHSPNFTDADVRFLASLAETLAEGLRRRALSSQVRASRPSASTAVPAATRTPTPGCWCWRRTTASRWPTRPPIDGWPNWTPDATVTPRFQ